MKPHFHGERTRPACSARRRAGHTELSTITQIDMAIGAFEPVGATPTGATGSVALPISK